MKPLRGTMKQYRYIYDNNKGSIRNVNLSPMEYAEYKQTGMIKIKETPLSYGELSRLKYESVNYYDWCEKQAARTKPVINLDELWDLMD